MKKKSKRYKKLEELRNKEKKIEVKELIELVKNNANSKFDESIDVSLRINLKQSKGGELSLRTVVKLPNGTGKKIRLQFCVSPQKLMKQKKVEQKYLDLMI